MKKFITLLIAMLMCLSLVACGGNGKTKFTVKNNEGNISEMTISELYEASKNEAQFEKLYEGAKVSFTATVKEIKTNYTINNSSTVFDSIDFGDVILYTNHAENEMFDILGYTDSIYDYSEINIGDELNIESGTLSRRFGGIDISGCEKIKKIE